MKTTKKVVKKDLGNGMVEVTTFIREEKGDGVYSTTTITEVLPADSPLAYSSEKEDCVNNTSEEPEKDLIEFILDADDITDIDDYAKAIAQYMDAKDTAILKALKEHLTPFMEPFNPAKLYEYISVYAKQVNPLFLSMIHNFYRCLDEFDNIKHPEQGTYGVTAIDLNLIGPDIELPEGSLVFPTRERAVKAIILAKLMRMVVYQAAQECCNENQKR